jgi:hypothetical protein
MDDSVSRIFVKFKTRSGNEVFWGMWFTKQSAIEWASEEMKNPQNQAIDDPFIGFELVYTNVLSSKIGLTQGVNPAV